MDCDHTRAFILTQCARYPGLRPRDILKGLYQSTFGCGHLVSDPSAAADFIRREAKGCRPVTGPLIEPLDGGFIRVHLAGLEGSGVTAEELARLFAASAAVECGSVEELEERLAVLLELAEGGELPFSAEETGAAVAEWRQMGYPPCHHSEEFRRLHGPAYRVLWQTYGAGLPAQWWRQDEGE